MKQRFSSLDVRVISSELKSSLTTLRVSNIYDLSTRIFLLKFAKPGKREQLLVDSGFRAHLTSFTRTAASAPSPFVSRLRKYLKSRRVTNVSQIGTDRVIEISFSDSQYRLFLEFFAAGNIILTDAELNVLALLRQVNEGNEAVDVRLGVKYVLDAKQNYHGIPEITEARIHKTLEDAQLRVKAAQDVGGKKAKRAKGGDDLRKALSAGFPEYPPHLLEHVFKLNGIAPIWNIEDVLGNRDNLTKIMHALGQASDVFESLGTVSAKGYIISKLKDTTQENEHPDQEPSRDEVLYDDFHPFRPAQFEGKPDVIIFEHQGYNKTVDEFYSSIESQKLETRVHEHEDAATRKLQKAKDEHEKRLGALQHVQELHIRKAQAIEANTHRVEEACAAVNGLIGQGMDWVDIGKLIENEQARGNPVAQLIKLPLKLQENTVTLLLDEPGLENLEESDEDDLTDDESESVDEESSNNREPADDRRLAIDIDLAASPWANSRQYYDQKKQAAVKEQKTMQASAKALKSTERKIQDDLKRGLKHEKDVLRPFRRQFWFEKFLWFISSDGYLVLGGKDAQQNEILYRRYLKKGDIYVHADLHGASSVIVRNNLQTPDAPIPPSTLSQAGALTVCTSSAWDSKAVMAAWWVYADQVSKTAPTGEYLTTGGFVVRGKKNFLPPSQLLLGFGIVWLISEESQANHGKHRLVKTQSMVSGEAEALVADAQELSVQDDNVDEHEADEAENLTHEANSHVPDVEDAANDVASEVSEPQDGSTTDRPLQQASDDESDHDDRASTVASDLEDGRANPLQNGQHTDSKQDQAQKHEATDDESQSQEEDDMEEDTSGVRKSGADTSTSSAPSNGPKQKPLARGKRAKAKRAAKKYEWQDEEDRELSMALLGSNKAAERQQVAEEDKAAREAKMEADKARRRKQHEKNAEHERERQARLERGDVEAGEELDAEQLEQERQEHENIDLLVPMPEPGDELISAIPVVGPWTALGRCKYRVKLQPGGTKKGKAVKEIVAGWSALALRGKKVYDEENQDRERVWQREVDLIKGWRMEEVVGSLPVKGVRIVQGGGLGGATPGGGGGGAKGKGGGSGARGGKGSKKPR